MLKDNLLKELSCLDLNLARLKCLTLLLTSLLRHRTVNLTILASENFSGAKNESCYRRFQNFFLRSHLCLTSIGGFILQRIPRPAEGWVLSMDRTNWKYGKLHINILTVGIVINKVAVPVVWKVLPQKTKRGNSNTKQRIAITQKLLLLMEPEDIRVLTMDREFGGEKWLKWLESKCIGYVVRIKSNTIIDGMYAREYGTTRKSEGGKRRAIWGMGLFFSSKVIQSKGRRDSRLYVISNRYGGKEALELYKLRWGIEQLFSHLKKRGFDLEATHMTDCAKLEKLFALVSLAFLISFGWGLHLRKDGRANQAVRRKSLFRQGLEGILRLLNNRHLPKTQRQEFGEWLKSPFLVPNFVV